MFHFIVRAEIERPEKTHYSISDADKGTDSAKDQRPIRRRLVVIKRRRRQRRPRILLRLRPRPLPAKQILPYLVKPRQQRTEGHAAHAPEGEEGQIVPGLEDHSPAGEGRQPLVFVLQP